MWTNIFRIGELQTVSWFQFLPVEPDLSALSERSTKAEQKDAATYTVLSAHLLLQSEGFLTTWTNSFVGPWDPSQGVHNPDEKIKLWLFLPGRHSSVVETAQTAVSRLRVVASGLWISPGNSEEVAVALSQALRNSIERALRGLSYVRFGDAFTKCNPSSKRDASIRRAQPTIEFVFAATEEAVYVHVVISAKHVRNLCSGDIEKVLMNSSSSIGEGLPVVVAPSGMLGRLVGCCPSDLVKQVYFSKLTPHGSTAGLHYFTQSTGCQLRGQNYYVEVALGCPSAYTEKDLESDTNRSTQNLHFSKDSQLMTDRQRKIEPADHLPALERTFIYPPEAVLIPMIDQAFAQFSKRRLVLQNSVGNSSWETWPFWNFSCSAAFFDQCSNVESSRGFGNSSTLRLKKQYNSSSNSVSSSNSSVSSTSNESEQAVAAEGGDLDADADSLARKQSDVPSNSQFDSNKMVSKRPRSDMTEISSQSGKGVRENMHDTAAAGLANVQGGSFWFWENGGLGMDINALISEFGDFDDFFGGEVLDLGEIPGTAESQAPVLHAADFADITFSASPSTAMDIPDQRLSPVGLASFEGLNHQSVLPIEDIGMKTVEPMEDVTSPAVSQSSVLSNSKFDHLTKAEAILTFAPEYAAVEFPASEVQSLFKTPYLPKSKDGASSSSYSSRVYSYDCTQSSWMESFKEHSEKSAKLKSCAPGQDINSLKLYTLVQSRTKETDGKSDSIGIISCKGEISSDVSGINSFGSSLTLQKKNDNIFDAGYFLLSMKTALATEIESMMFQAAMCRIRHTLLSLRNRVPVGLRGALSNLIQSEAGSKLDLMIPTYENVKKENIPVRLSSDIDGEIFDGSLMGNVGVWRSVGPPKRPKQIDVRSTEVKPFTVKSLNACTPRQPLLDFLSAMALLVQQSTSFVDIAFDMGDGDGSYSWLSMQEQRRRGFSCDPSMVHAGCGGLLATCHSLDFAGNNLVDPLAADVSVSSVISLLQSDIKVAMKSAFGNMDGPLSVIEWCKGRSNVIDSGTMVDGYSFQYSGDIRETSSTVTIGGDSMSPTQSTSSLSSNREGARADDSSQRRSNQDTCNSESEHQKGIPRFRPTLAVLPLPAFLVGYQDDWLKTSSNCFKAWEKAPFEPYALSKPVSYYALCPDIDILTTATADFVQQLGTVYEICKLGTHSPQTTGGQMETSLGKCLPSGLVLVECPEQMRIGGRHVNAIISANDYFQALSKSWSVKSFVTSLAKTIKDLKLSSSAAANQKEISSGPSTVMYVVCPFPEPYAILQTLIECSVALGSATISPDREKKAMLHSLVAKALNCTAAADEPSASNVVMLSGFSIPKLVLQIIPVETLLRVNTPSNEVALLKDIAFTVYNKVRRTSRAISTGDMLQSSTFLGRPQPSLMHVTSPVPTLWKECLVPRMSGPTLTRETEYDTSLRPISWDNSWQSPRAGGMPDPNRLADLYVQDDKRYIFEPLFILAEPGSVEQTATLESSKPAGDDSAGVYVQNSVSGASMDTGTSNLLEGSEHELGAASLHCCYGWTEDWRWLVCIWTDSRGELLDSLIFPFGGISSRQDTKVLQNLFIQILQQGCQILSSSPEAGTMKPRDFIITRLGTFFELEVQEWQRAIYSFGGNEVKKWPVQLRRSIPEGILSNANGPTLQQQEMGLVQERNMPSSPSPSLYSPHAKSSFMKGALGQSSNKKQMLVEQSGMDSPRGSLHFVQSISLIAVSLDHSLCFAVPADVTATGGRGTQSSSGPTNYVEGFSPVKTIGSMSASYLLIPSPSLRYLSPTTLQLPTCLTSESPPLAHLLHSKGSAIPIATGYVVSKAVGSATEDAAAKTKEDWPSVLSVSLIDHYGGGSNANVQEKIARGAGSSNFSKQGRSFASPDAMSRDYEMEVHTVLESVSAELNALSWMTVSPVYLERRTALPFHCDMVLRLRRLLHYADKELSQPVENMEQT